MLLPVWDWFLKSKLRFIVEQKQDCIFLQNHCAISFIHVKVFEIISPLVDTPMTAGRGKGKITPERFVEEFIRAFRKDKFEVNIGKVKLLKIINRISPLLAERIMKNGGEK
jgi:short-subunit dehydrogenase involved in D-alanine esterification of teichoic acids